MSDINFKSRGSEFHNLGPMNEKDRPPQLLFFMEGITRSLFLSALVPLFGLFLRRLLMYIGTNIQTDQTNKQTNHPTNERTNEQTNKHFICISLFLLLGKFLIDKQGSGKVRVIDYNKVKNNGWSVLRPDKKQTKPATVKDIAKASNIGYKVIGNNCQHSSDKMYQKGKRGMCGG